MEERECVTHAKDVLNTFGQMKSDEKYCDFTLVIGGEEIPVHRMVLAASSKYFDAMFSHDMAEKKTSRAEILGIEPSVGKQCIEYAYTGKIKFSRENPRDLIHAAEMMQLHSLIGLYFNFLMEGITAENCLEYMELAQTYNKGNFAKVFKKFLIENFRKIIETEDFASMSEELLCQCLHSLTDDAQDTEKMKWEAATKWVRADLESRKDSFSKVFKLIRFGNLSGQFIKEKIAKDPLVKGSNELKIMIFDHVYAADQTQLQTESVDLGEAPNHILAFHKESRLLHKYNLKTEEWSRFLRFPSGMVDKYFDIVSLQGEIYLGDGATLSRYRDGTWTKLFNSSNKSCYCRCLLHGSDILMVTNTRVFRYHSKADTCEEIQAFCDLGEGFAIAASNDFLYAAGGSRTNNKARELNFALKVWEPVSTMNCELNNGALIIFCGKLISLGEYYWDTKRCLEYYDPMLDKWLMLPNTEANKCLGSNSRLFVKGNKLYMVGHHFKVQELKLEFGEDENKTTGMASDAFFNARLG